jgi:hypothetical protein
MANGMKKIIIVLMIFLFLFLSCWGSDENGNDVLILSKRDRCENTVREMQNALDPETCIVTLATLLPAKGGFIDLTLITCLNYQFEMAKCKKKSDVLPP